MTLSTCDSALPSVSVHARSVSPSTSFANFICYDISDRRNAQSRAAIVGRIGERSEIRFSHPESSIRRLQASKKRRAAPRRCCDRRSDSRSHCLRTTRTIHREREGGRECLLLAVAEFVDGARKNASVYAEESPEPIASS